MSALFNLFNWFRRNGVTDQGTGFNVPPPVNVAPNGGLPAPVETKKSVPRRIPLKTKMAWLEKFKKENGHLKVPTKHEKLGIWVQELRRCAKTCQRNEKPKFNYFNKTFVIKLHKMGFFWGKNIKTQDFIANVKD